MSTSNSLCAGLQTMSWWKLQADSWRILMIRELRPGQQMIPQWQRLTLSVGWTQSGRISRFHWSLFHTMAHCTLLASLTLLETIGMQLVPSLVSAFFCLVLKTVLISCEHLNLTVLFFIYYVNYRGWGCSQNVHFTQVPISVVMLNLCLPLTAATRWVDCLGTLWLVPPATFELCGLTWLLNLRSQSILWGLSRRVDNKQFQELMHLPWCIWWCPWWCGEVVSSSEKTNVWVLVTSVVHLLAARTLVCNQSFQSLLSLNWTLQLYYKSSTSIWM